MSKEGPEFAAGHGWVLPFNQEPTIAVYGTQQAYPAFVGTAELFSLGGKVNGYAGNQGKRSGGDNHEDEAGGRARG